jgi:putative heme transporter
VTATTPVPADPVAVAPPPPSVPATLHVPDVPQALPALDEHTREGQHAQPSEATAEQSVRRGRRPAAWTDGFGAFSVRCLQVLIVATVTAAVVVAAAQLKVVLIPIMLSLILASAFNPATRWLERHGWPRALAALSTLVLGLGVLGAVLVGITLAVIAQWATLVTAAGGGVTRIEVWLKSTGVPIDQQKFDEVRQAAVSFFTSGSFASNALGGLSTVTSLLTGLVLLLFVLFFFLKDGRAIWELLLRPVRGAGRERAERIGLGAVRVLGGYARGTAFIALVDAVLIGAGLLILRVPLAIPLAVLVFGMAFIPVIGSALAGLIAALVALVTGGPVTALIVVAIVVVVNQLESILLQPVVMGRTVSLHPLAILLALTLGAVLAGVIGALLAVPIASVVWVAIKSWHPGDPQMAALEAEAPPT